MKRKMSEKSGRNSLSPVALQAVQLSQVPTGSLSDGGDVIVYVFDIHHPSFHTPFHSVFVSISGFVAFSTVFQLVLCSLNDTCFFVCFVLLLFFLICKDYWGRSVESLPTCFFFFFEVVNSLHALVLLFKPGSVHSGSAS